MSRESLSGAAVAGRPWWRSLGRTEIGLVLANVAVYVLVLMLDPNRNFTSSGMVRLLLTEVQRPGRKRISALELARQLDLDQVQLGLQD